MIQFEPSVRRRMLDDALGAFPDECCGFLFGIETAGGDRVFTDILVVNNAKEGDKRRRFEIAPRDYLRAERHSEETGLQLLSIYHSHPKHPAVPSEHDRVAAQPFFSYVIVSVAENGETGLRSWRLNDEAQFEEEGLDNAAAHPALQA